MHPGEAWAARAPQAALKMAVKEGNNSQLRH